jgi:hypothetical protein
MAIRKEGAFLEILLPNNKFCYSRILPKAEYAFYDIISEERINDIEKLQNTPILFIIAVYKFAVTKGRWKKIGFKELNAKLQILPMKFIEDVLNPGSFSLYKPKTGEMTPTTKDKCIGLERSAVWEPEHVEERLLAHFENRPCKWMEQLRLK